MSKKKDSRLFKDGEENVNYKHGLCMSNRGEYYNHLPDSDKQWIDAIVEDLVEKSYYTMEDISAVEKCRHIAVDLHQRRRADGYIADKGITQENTIGFHEEYGEISETQENVLMITKDRLSRESRLAMKDLGILDHEDVSEESKKSILEQIEEKISEDEE